MRIPKKSSEQIMIKIMTAKIVPKSQSDEYNKKSPSNKKRFKLDPEDAPTYTLLDEGST